MPPAAKTIASALLTFYPAYCNSASPTWFAWVKLSAYDLHHSLRPRAGFSDNNAVNAYTQSLTLFYLNHPIQYVQLVGVVVTYEDYNERFYLFTVDDSSGETIEVVCPKPAKEKDRAKLESKKPDEKTAEDEDEAALIVTVSQLDIGTVVQVKGTIGVFREIRQLQLKRIKIVADTNEEMLWIDARTKALEDVLSKPWVISPARQKRLLKEARGEAETVKTKAAWRKEREAKRQEREKRHAARITRNYDKEEARRDAHAREAREAGVALRSQIREVNVLDCYEEDEQEDKQSSG